MIARSSLQTLEATVVGGISTGGTFILLSLTPLSVVLDTTLTFWNCWRSWSLSNCGVPSTRPAHRCAIWQSKQRVSHQFRPRTRSRYAPLFAWNLVSHCSLWHWHILARHILGLENSIENHLSRWHLPPVYHFRFSGLTADTPTPTVQVCCSPHLFEFEIAC